MRKIAERRRRLIIENLPCVSAIAFFAIKKPDINNRTGVVFKVVGFEFIDSPFDSFFSSVFHHRSWFVAYNNKGFHQND